MTPAAFADTVGMQLSAADAAVIIASLAEAGYEIRRKAAPRAAKAVDAIPPGLAFALAHDCAKRAALAELGERWYLVPGATIGITIPPRLATYRFRRKDGSLSIPIRNRRDYRAPAPRFWPGGQLPAGATTDPDAPARFRD